MIICFFLLTFLLLLCRLSNGELTLEKSNILKALFPYMIILHHISQATGVFLDFRWAGPYGVGIFFFISGYGLEYKRLKGQLGFHSYFVRIKNVFLPILLPVFIYLLLLSTDDINIGVFIINKLKDYSIVFPYTWFVLTLTVLYTSYYLLSSLLKGALLYISELLFLLIFSYIMIIFQIDGTTFITTYCFLAGAIYNIWKNIYVGFKHAFMLLLLFICCL